MQVVCMYVCYVCVYVYVCMYVGYVCMDGWMEGCRLCMYCMYICMRVCTMYVCYMCILKMSVYVIVLISIKGKAERTLDNASPYIPAP